MERAHRWGLGGRGKKALGIGIFIEGVRLKTAPAPPLYTPHHTLTHPVQLLLGQREKLRGRLAKGAHVAVGRQGQATAPDSAGGRVGGWAGCQLVMWQHVYNPPGLTSAPMKATKP